ncbi:alginate lyase family protein [Pontiellaceae bacterium B1224]|nr:alginate lyase family protein [Pontiellaceae bacterium B1224]
MKYLFLFLMAAFAVMADRTFVHPGCLHKKSDLDRMKYMVEAGEEPYLKTFKKLQEYPKSSYDYKVQGDLSRTDTKGGAFTSDATAAYLNALMWSITGDERHAAKCVEIFNAWQNLTQSNGFALRSGNDPWKMIEGAEIIRSTYDGWSQADIEKFQAMLVYPGYSTTEIPEGNKTFYWNIVNGDPDRHGNQDAIGFRAMISIAVFLDNEIMFDRALNYYKGLPHREDDLPYAAGPSESTVEVNDTPYHTVYKHKRESRKDDWGYNGTLANYFWENGQCQESSRDQQHTYYGLSIFQMWAEVAWNQGDPAWNDLDNRLLKAFEFSARYNTSFIQSYPDQSTPWEPTVESGEFIQRKDRTGRWFSKAICPFYEGNEDRLSRGEFIKHRPIYEQGWAHFNVRMGQGDQAVWTKRSLDLVDIEENGWTMDHPGWGGLTFHRPDGCAGDPISGFKNGVPVFDMPVLPATIEAENYDYFPDIGNGRTYHDSTEGNRNKAYRNDDVDIVKLPDGGHALTELMNGEWLTYTVYVPTSGNYDLGVRYMAREEGQIRFDFGEQAVKEAVTLPVTDSWATSIVAEKVPLQQGVQQLKISVLGRDAAYILDQLIIEKTQVVEEPTVVAKPEATVTNRVLETAEIVAVHIDVEEEDPSNQKLMLLVGGGVVAVVLLGALARLRRKKK